MSKYIHNEGRHRADMEHIIKEHGIDAWVRIANDELKKLPIHMGIWRVTLDIDYKDIKEL